MTLQLASAAKTSSDNVTLQERSVVGSSIMNIIDTEITRVSNKTGVYQREYKAFFTFEAIVNESPLEIVKPGNNISMYDLEKALNKFGYRVSLKAIKSSKPEANGRVKMQVAWG